MRIKHSTRSGDPTPTRRELWPLAAAAWSVILVPTQPNAAPSDLQAAIAKITLGAKLNPGRVKIDIPPLVENGNTVPCTVKVESPMTAEDHVKAIHVLNEKNPQSDVISCRLGIRAGRAEIQTRIRLADTQTVVAIAEMSDGSFWTESTSVIITLGACLEEPI